MTVLLIGGTGLISTGIIKHLRTRGAQISMFNRGKRGDAPADVTQITGDRNADDFVGLFRDQKFDCVIDMICFNRAQAEASIRAFAGRCEHFIFCSTVCTYGVKIPPGVMVAETFAQEPISDYGRNKVICENLFLEADARGDFAVTIVRPSCTYGPGGSLIDNLEGNAAAWDRVARGLPVLCAGDGLGLWVATHRDDCGKFFAYAALNRKTYGQSYNATRKENFTWRDFYREAALSLGHPARLLFMPAQWIVKHDPKRFGLLAEITQYHGAYTSAKARRDVPEFVCEIDFATGARQTFEDMRRRDAWRDAKDDNLYQQMVDAAVRAGVEPIEV